MDGPFGLDVPHDIQEPFRPENVDRNENERDQVNSAVGRELAEDNAGGLRDAEFVPVEAGEEPATPPFKSDP